MKDYGPDSFGDYQADHYDRDPRHPPAEVLGRTVELLAGLADGSRILELAIGTGRIALPLAERGLEVHGFDASQKMLDKLAEKDPAGRVHTFVADMTDFATDGHFSLAFLAYNTLFNLVTQADQVACFRCAARCLAPGGRFVVEAFVPRVAEMERSTIRTVDIGDHSAMVEMLQHDPVNQRVDYQYLRIGDGRFSMTPLPMRYAWPAEMDLMAELAGMRLEARYAGWDSSAFTADSASHVSVYRLDGELP